MIESLQFSVLVRIAPRSRCCRRPFVSVLPLSPRSPHHSIGLFLIRFSSPLLSSHRCRRGILILAGQKKAAKLPLRKKRRPPTARTNLVTFADNLKFQTLHIRLSFEHSLVAFVLVRLGWHEQSTLKKLRWIFYLATNRNIRNKEKDSSVSLI